MLIVLVVTFNDNCMLEMRSRSMDIVWTNWM